MVPKDFDIYHSAEWMRKHWTRSISYALCYVLFIFLGQQWMKQRPKYDLRIPLTVWNSVLAVFSIFGFFRTFPEFFHILSNKGFDYSICNASFEMGVGGFWAWIFALSKVLELGDTVFIVLRKQLIFLHWYHHITVLVYTWYSFPDRTAPGRWFVVMNYTVHSFMYTYYALRALRCRMPRIIPMTITFMQLAQMIVGTYINIAIYFIKTRGASCNQTDENQRFSLLMYLSYFILFAHFFYKAYYGNGKFAREVAKRAQQEVSHHDESCQKISGEQKKVD